MRHALLVCAFLFAPGCATPLDDAGCALNDTELTALKLNAREFLESELGELYVYYDHEGSVLDSVIAHDGSCAILILPESVADDGSALLHGEGMVLFDRQTLVPKEVQFFSW